MLPAGNLFSLLTLVNLLLSRPRNPFALYISVCIHDNRGHHPSGDVSRLAFDKIEKVQIQEAEGLAGRRWCVCYLTVQQCTNTKVLVVLETHDNAAGELSSKKEKKKKRKDTQAEAGPSQVGAEDAMEVDEAGAYMSPNITLIPSYLPISLSYYSACCIL